MPELGALPITKLTAAHIQATYTKWATEGRRDGKKGGLSPRTRRHIHRIFNCALARAVEQQVLARNPGDAFRKRLPKVERREMVTLSPEQSARLLEGIEHTRFYWPVLLALSTGMRRGETLAVRWKNVDLERGTLCVMESLEQTKSGIRFKAPKTDRVRVVTLPAFATEAPDTAQARASGRIAAARRSTNRGDPSLCPHRWVAIAAANLNPSFRAPSREDKRFAACVLPRPPAQPRNAAPARWGSPQNCPGAARTCQHHHDARSLFTCDRHDAERRCSTARRGFPKCYKPHRKHKMNRFR